MSKWLLKNGLIERTCGTQWNTYLCGSTILSCSHKSLLTLLIMSVYSLSYMRTGFLKLSSYLLYFFPILFSKLQKLSDFTMTLLHFFPYYFPSFGSYQIFTMTLLHYLLILTDGVTYKSHRLEYDSCLTATPDKALSICQLKFHHMLEMENKLAEIWRMKTKLRGQLPIPLYIGRIKLVLISIYSSSFLFKNKNKCLCILIINYILSWFCV